ncbi:OmpA family protein [Fulvivirga sediminis]|uniref:PD40 domain-containing protein n=1 Tax=Fulvivirga sediminis TaxID=2803949 RepID=A0A937FBM5_9BACT|nr:OmpA family protein [Fulvivirga sediminis]MBL3657885.1 PD40 domain-containing protein [Fulvivirga sediminis]
MSANTKLLTLLLTLVIVSCSLEKKANKAFSNGEFESTIEIYNRALKKDASDPVANFFVADSYRQSNRLDEAEPYYKKALDNGLDNDSIRLFYAFSLKANGKYEQAREQVNEHLENVVEEKYRARGEEEISNLNSIDDIRRSDSFFKVKNLEEINSNQADYAPVYNDGELYFSSSRDDNKIYKATGTPFSNIYKVKTKGANVDTTTIEGLGELINNFDINEGSVTFSPDGKTMVFARGNSGKRKGTADVNLYIASNRNGTWTEPRMLTINNPGYWDSTPAFSRDGQTLYFASNRPGGYGGTDIYSARRNSRGRFYRVTNLGPTINSAGNEMFPFVSDEGFMYFASDGHAGFGGLDLFIAKRQNGKTTIENLGEPMNTTADDFGLFLFRADRGFFSSNREGGKGDDDIYTFVNEDPNLKIVNYYLTGVTMTHDDADNLVVLPGVTVRLLDNAGEELDEKVTDGEGKFSFRVYEHERYNLVGEKKGGTEQYLITRQEFSTIGRSVNRDTLTQLVTNVKFDTLMVLEKIEKDKIFVLENIYYDLDKSDIREDAARELDKLVTILNDNPELVIELSSHTDARQTDEYNLKLSQRRAKSAVDYLVSQGIESKRLTAKGYGESKLLIEDAQTEEEHQVNRRTEFKILELGKPKKSDDEFYEDRFFDDDGDL